MNLCSTSVIILLLYLKPNANSKCTEIQTYENGFPPSISRLANDDYIGAGAILLHSSFLRTTKYWPNYFVPGNCVAHVIKIAGRKSKFSLRPLGCCSICCLIDRVEDHMTIYFYSKNRPLQSVKLSTKKKAGNLAALGYSNYSKNVILLHGFGDAGYEEDFYSLVPKAYAKRNGNFYLMVVDFSNLVALPWYHEGVDNVKLAAKALADFLIFYHKTGELSIENTHAIGLSLGAQLAGHLGRTIKKFKKLGRVTGMDPAFPLYDEHNPLEYINKGDAEFVDIIHTTSGIYGVREGTGHADFFVEYPPGTISRPGCNLLRLFDRGELADYLYICDHVRSARLYLHSVSNPYLFPVCKNTTVVGSNSSEVCGYLGFAASKSTTFGKYHLTTPVDWDPYEDPETVE